MFKKTLALASLFMAISISASGNEFELAGIEQQAFEIKETTINGESIKFYDNNVDGPAITLIHGNSASGSTFANQLLNKAGHLHGFRIVAIDLPGHGLTGAMKTPEQAYSVAGMSGIVKNFLVEQSLDCGIQVGWSLGGNILLEIADGLDCSKGLFLYGAPPIANPVNFGEAYLPNPAINAGYNPDLTDEDRDNYVNAMVVPWKSASFEQRKDARITDDTFRRILGASILLGQYKDQVAEISALHMPVAILQGAQEQITNADYLDTLDIPTLWRNEIITVHNAGHAIHLENRFEFDYWLGTFARSQF